MAGGGRGNARSDEGGFGNTERMPLATKPVGSKVQTPFPSDSIPERGRLFRWVASPDLPPGTARQNPSLVKQYSLVEIVYSARPALSSRGGFTDIPRSPRNVLALNFGKWTCIPGVEYGTLFAEKFFNLGGSRPMATKSRKHSARRKSPSNAGRKRPTKIARRMARPVEIETGARIERSPNDWAKLIDSLVEQRGVAVDRLAKLRARIAPLLIDAESVVGTDATEKLRSLRFDVNETDRRITELDDAIALARVELAKAESKAAAKARSAAVEELEEVHAERMVLAGLIDDALENLGTLVREWDGLKFGVTSIGRRIHGAEGDSAASIGRQLWQGQRRALRYALWKHAPILAELVELPREPQRWHQDLQTGECYLSSQMLRDGEADRFERSLQLASTDTGPTETREEVIARLKREPVDEGEMRLRAVQEGLAEEEAANAATESDEDDPREAAVAGEMGFSVRG